MCTAAGRVLMAVAQCRSSHPHALAVQCPQPGPLWLQPLPRMEDTGWTHDAVYNWANALSMGRLLSGPAIAYMIMHGMWAPAVCTLAVAGGAPQSALACLPHVQAQACPDVWPASAVAPLRPASVCMICMGCASHCGYWHLWAGVPAQSRPMSVVSGLDNSQLGSCMLPAHDPFSSSPP